METTNQTPVQNKPESPKALVGIKNLTQKAIIIQLSISKFVGSRIDKRVTEDVAKEEKTSQDYVKVTKTLMKSEQSKKVQNAEQKLRAEFYKLTAPWNREGEGVCRITDYIKIKTRLEELSREYYSAVDELVNNYDEIVKADKVKLGNMFNVDDYPSKENFKSRFYVKIEPKAIESNDFRSGVLSDDEVKDINNQIEERLSESIATAQIDNLNRVKEKIAHLFQRLYVSDGKFHNSAVMNCIEALEQAKSLNINDDSGLDGIFDQLINNIVQIDAESVRENKNVREAASKTAKEALETINEAMKCFMG